MRFKKKNSFFGISKNCATWWLYTQKFNNTALEERTEVNIASNRRIYLREKDLSSGPAPCHR
jgi:hypothetical protein